MTLLANFFCKLLYVCSRTLRFAGVCFLRVSYFQRRSHGVRGQRGPFHTLMLGTDWEICWDHRQITVPLCLSFPICKMGE